MDWGHVIISGQRTVRGSRDQTMAPTLLLLEREGGTLEVYRGQACCSLSTPSQLWEAHFVKQM